MPLPNVKPDVTREEFDDLNQQVEILTVLVDKFVSEDEKAAAIARVREDNAGQ